MYILIAIVVFFLVLAIIISFQKPDFRISREITINAPADVVFSLINDFHNWAGWSPWVKMDPNAKSTFKGAASGAGAIYSWKGNNKVGEGVMTLTESHPAELIKIDLQFIKPFKAKNRAEFIIKAENAQTNLSWTMYGKNSFMGKAVNMVMNCEKMVGGQFMKGLTDIKTIAEAKK